MTDATAKPRKRLSTRAKVIWGIALALVVVVVVIIGAYAIRLNNAASQIEQIQDAFPEDSDRPEVPETDGNAAINILLLGSDSRNEGTSIADSLGDRSDTIMVAHIPPDRGSVQLMSIMRDSWVDIPGHGTNKINAAFSLGGVPLAVQTIEGLIGQRIDHVAVIDFDGFAGLTDALGGVTVQNDIAFSSGGFEFAQGEVVLTGESALRYVRERHAFADADYQRVHNQQAFMHGVLNAVMNRETLTDPNRIAQLIETMSPYIATTDGLTPTVMIDLAQQLANVGGGGVQSFTMPTLGTGTEGNQSVVYVNEEALALVQEAFAAESMASFTPPNER